ncbi:hypothetical protein BC940DRAFT_78423 [Gongronella butleri]|nr:hypothetical protein BC940DRAFT_78423 [Gongronella butleri]
MTTVLQRSLQYVQSNNGTISEEMLANASLDTDHRLLQHIEAHELTEDDNVGMLAGPVQSSNSTTASTYTYPVTPDLSPSQQHQLQQRKQQWYDRNRSHALLHQHRAHQDSAFYDGFSDADTLDREVAATTSGLGLVSPEQSPYYSLQARALQHATNGTPSTSNNGQINGNINGNGLLRDNPVPEPTRSTATVSETRRRRKSTAAASSASHLSISEQALEALQTQVAALTEQLEHMKLRLVAKEEHKRQMRWSWLWMTKTVAKHALINLVILFLVFMLLLRRRSPIAYDIIGYVGPRIQDLLRYFRKRLFFFVTV